MMQIFGRSEKIKIPKYNKVSYSEAVRENFFSVVVKNNFNMHVSCFMRTFLLLFACTLKP